MMPLTLADTRRDLHHLKGRRQAGGACPSDDLGFVAGGDVQVITDMMGNLIVNVKETRVAISKEMAAKIMV